MMKSIGMEYLLVTFILLSSFTNIHDILAFQGPMGPEMLALRLAFRANLFQTNERTHTPLYVYRYHLKSSNI